MKRLLLTIAMLVAGLSVFTSCGAPAANNSANKPANNANIASPTAPVNTAAIEADIKKLVTEYAASTAKNDAEAYEKVTSDNFMFVGNDGSIQTKAERVSSMRSGQTKYETLTYDDVNVRVNPEGDGAVVIAKATVKGTNMGKPIDADVRVTQVWSKTKDVWKLASLQATTITAKANDKTAAKADDKTKVDDKKSDANKSSAMNSEKAPAANK
ncbi:MAG: nuclear transport factor 2 family protein [Pyrinomonadaceae bacterium]